MSSGKALAALAMNAYMGVETHLHALLDLAVDGGDWLFARPGYFSCGAEAPSAHSIGAWLGLCRGLY